MLTFIILENVVFNLLSSWIANARAYGRVTDETKCGQVSFGVFISVRFATKNARTHFCLHMVRWTTRQRFLYKTCTVKCCSEKWQWQGGFYGICEEILNQRALLHMKTWSRTHKKVFYILEWVNCKNGLFWNLSKMLFESSPLNANTL